ncbi:hypothetical protein B0G84_5702 [Paraburkholderia sp. BL8N3]|nr:hypothetical protein B0G84_5702 [Paraburkholderia sp. BL8N3]
MQTLFKHRSYLRYLSRQQRRSWFEQWQRANPRVAISSAYLPPNVTRAFCYVKFS